MQAFFIKATGSNPYLVVNNNARLHGVSPYKESGVEKLLELTVTGNGFSDKTYINFNENSSLGFDSEYDGYKLLGIDEAPQLFTYIGEEMTSINVLPEIEQDMVVPAGLKVGAEGEYTISASDLANFGSDVTIYLEDLKEAKMINLMEQNEYSFVSSPIDTESRFRLHFSGLSVQGEQEQIIKSEEIDIYSCENSLFIRSNTEKPLNGQVIVYNIMGQQMLNKKLEQINLNKIDLKFETGYYVVKVLIDSGIYSKKVFIK